jgi:hypothetical protein
VVARVGEEQLGSGYGLSLPGVADVAGVEEIPPSQGEVRKFGLGQIVIDPEALVALEAVRNPAVDALSTKLSLEVWLVGLVLGKLPWTGPSSLALFRKEQSIKGFAHAKCLPDAIAAGSGSRMGADPRKICPGSMS